MGLITGPLSRRAKRRYAGMEVLREEIAVSLGVESAGPWQVRGNGNLALTESELLFVQWLPNRMLQIPRKTITEVGTTRSHLGKTMGTPLLKVGWTNEVSEPDSIAVWLKDVDGWIEALGGQRSTDAAPA